MFEDSTFESAGRIRTRSRRWIIAAFAFNASILLAFILIPLICPEALPRQVLAFLMEVPTPPAPQLQPRQSVRTAPPPSQMLLDQFVAPRKIPPNIVMVADPEPPLNLNPATWETNPTASGSDPFGERPAVTVVHPPARTPLRVSSTVEAGLLIQEKMPVYPSIAKAARVEGKVMLTATISKTGAIENLRVTGGPAMLQQAALDAVKTWLYRPYLLDGQPVEVETTVNVIFTLER